MVTTTRPEALISDAIRAGLDNNHIRLTPLLERRFIAAVTDHITCAGYTLTLTPHTQDDA